MGIVVASTFARPDGLAEVVVLLVCEYLLPFNDVKPAYTVALACKHLAALLTPCLYRVKIWKEL